MRTSFLTMTLLIGLGTVATTQSYSDHFTIEKLSEGVYAAIATHGGHGISNAGIVDLGDFTLVFDACMTPEAGEDLRKTAQHLTGKPVKYLVNSHVHNDHVCGNIAFRGSTIISTTDTRRLMMEELPELLEYYRSVAPVRLETYKAMDRTTMTAHEQAETDMWVGYFEALVGSLDSMELVPPDLTFDDRLVINGSERTVEILSFGTGHTESDAFLYIPNEQIAFMGDLLFIDHHPWMGDGNPESWIEYLDSVEMLGIKVVVPGHGPVGTAEDFATLKNYLSTVKALAKDFHQQGILPEEFEEIPAPAPFDQWFLSRFFRPNVINEHERLFGSQD